MASDSLRDRIAAVLHDAFPPDALYMNGCYSGNWADEPEGVKTVYRNQADAVIAALDMRETVRLLHAAATWIAGAIAEDDSGEPWLMARTLLNGMISRVDELGGWPQ